MDLELRFRPDPILRTKCTPITVVDEGIRQLAQEMLACLPRWGAAGLAAPQVGRPIRLFVTNVGAGLVFINPRIVSTASERVERIEGCLSLPGMQAIVSRPKSLVIESVGLDGNLYTIEAQGFKAVAIQHEADHLDGVLMIDPR